MSTAERAFWDAWVTVRRAPYPPLGAAGVTLLFAGMLSLMCLEIWTRGVAPVWTGAELSPALQLGAVFGGLSPAGAELAYVALALIGFPALFEFVIRPLSRAAETPAPTWLLGAEFGAFIFGLAMVFTVFSATPESVAPQGSALLSLIGYMIYGVVLALAIEAQDAFEYQT